jgi:hypothetical protein
VGIGTLQWGDPGTGFGTSYDEAALKEVFGTLVDGGVSFFDTAEVGIVDLEDMWLCIGLTGSPCAVNDPRAFTLQRRPLGVLKILVFEEM